MSNLLIVGLLTLYRLLVDLLTSAKNSFDPFSGFRSKKVVKIGTLMYLLWNSSSSPLRCVSVMIKFVVGIRDFCSRIIFQKFGKLASRKTTL